MPSTHSSSSRPAARRQRPRRTDTSPRSHSVHPLSGRCHPRSGQSVNTRIQEIAEGLRHLEGLPPGPRLCGRLRCADVVGLYVHTDGESKSASLEGVVRCGSSWGCVSCAWWLRYHQRRELEALVALWTAQGGTLALVTLTIRHSAALTLKDSVKGVRGAWRRLTRGNPWTRILSRLGAAHVIRTLDVTHGEGGWHVHVHAVAFLRPGAAPSQEVIQQVFARWSKQVEKQKDLGVRCVPMLEGLDWREVESASYLAKMKVADAAPGALSRSPWQIAAGAAEGVAGDIALWKEWVMAMKGTPSLPPPRHLAPVFAAIRAQHAQELAADRAARATPALDASSTDPEDSDGVTSDATTVVAAATSTDDAARHQEPDAQRRPITRKLIATFPAPVWDSLVRIRGAVADLLRRAVRGGLPSVAEGTAAHLFGITAEGVPEPDAVAWVLRVITPGNESTTAANRYAEMDRR